MRLVVTLLLVIAGWVQLARLNYAMGIWLILLPVAGWLAIWFGR